MKVFKFGGASLKSGKGVQNVASIIKSVAEYPLLVVVSAMGKTTDILEKIHKTASLSKEYQSDLQFCKYYHHQIIQDIFDQPSEILTEVDEIFYELETELNKEGEFDMIYDLVVSKGEIISSRIVYAYLQQLDIPCVWVDARTMITTDSSFREGKVDWKKTHANMQTLQNVCQQNVVITQGFIGKTTDGLTTTLGREGSDFTAAIFASSLNATSVTIWKDVPGVMSADPKRLPGAVVFEELPFKEAAEMTYYGASVIHPKTIKPLANKGIPLLVKNFENPALPGTKIHECTIEQLPPLIVFKDNQCLVSCKVTDYTFINEQQLSVIFQALNELDIRINVMQNSAISFSFCIDFRESKVMALIQKLHRQFEVYYNSGLTLITVKNYNEETFETYRKQPGVLLEQSSRSTLQVLVKP